MASSRRRHTLAAALTLIALVVMKYMRVLIDSMMRVIPDYAQTINYAGQGLGALIIIVVFAIPIRLIYNQKGVEAEGSKDHGRND